MAHTLYVDFLINTSSRRNPLEIEIDNHAKGSEL